MAQEPKEGFRPSIGQIGAGVVVLVLLAFAIANRESVEIHFLVTTVAAPLWLVFVVIIGLSFAAGYLVAGHRRRARAS